MDVVMDAKKCLHFLSESHIISIVYTKDKCMCVKDKRKVVR